MKNGFQRQRRNRGTVPSPIQGSLSRQLGAHSEWKRKKPQGHGSSTNNRGTPRFGGKTLPFLAAPNLFDRLTRPDCFLNQAFLPRRPARRSVRFSRLDSTVIFHLSRQPKPVAATGAAWSRPPPTESKWWWSKGLRVGLSARRWSILRLIAGCAVLSAGVDALGTDAAPSVEFFVSESSEVQISERTTQLERKAAGEEADTFVSGIPARGFYTCAHAVASGARTVCWSKPSGA